MIWKDYLKLFEIASHSNLARASKAHPLPPRRNRGKFGDFPSINVSVKRGFLKDQER